MIIKIIGAGAWGKSIAQPLQDNGHTVVFLKRGMISLADHDTVILALPTNAIRDALSSSADVKHLRVINCTKGIELTTQKLPYEIVTELLHPTTEYFALLGPSFASELREKMPTLINLGYAGSSENAQEVKQLFETKYLRIHTVQHIPSLELAGVMKNIYSIACGISDGLGFGMNTRTKLIITAIEEYYTFCKKKYYELDEHAIGGIIGDFMLTGNSATSRNFQFGKLLVRFSIEESLEKVAATVEGYAALDSLRALMQQAKVTLPLAQLVMDIIAMKDKKQIKATFLAYSQNV